MASFITSLLRFLLTRIVPLLVVVVAIIIGWLQSTEIPAGTFFATVIPLSKGYLPPTIVGHGRVSMQHLTPEVPDDMKPEGRPSREMFLDLPGSDQKMPANGLGMCCRPAAYDDVLVERQVLWYLLMGGRLIDGAMMYLNHEAIGKGIAEAVKRGVPRNEIFITTKLPSPFFGYNTTLNTVPKFLKELNVEYIDLLLLHFPTGIPYLIPKSKECATLSHAQCRQATWMALSQLREQGIIKNVGVSNFGIHHLKTIEELYDDGENSKKKKNIAPIAVNQISYNPWVVQSWVDTFQYCQQHGIAITAYNSLGGLFQHALSQTVDTLQTIASSHDKSVAQIMLRWSLQKKLAVIPGTGNPQHMRENLDVYNFSLSDDEMSDIDKLRNDEQAQQFFSMEPFKE